MPTAVQASTDPDTSPVAVGTEGATISASHVYQLPKKGGIKSATYNVRVSASDNAFASDTLTSAVTVTVSHPPSK